MNWLARMSRDWGPAMNAADRVRVVLAWGFLLGIVSHVGWSISHGDLWYYGPAPGWAPWFWYGVCVIDFAVFWLLLTRPRAGVIAGVATMTVVLIVNWTQFPTFEFGVNYVLIALTVFGAVVFVTAPWLWAKSRWSLGGTG